MEQLHPTAPDFKSATFTTPDFIEIKKNANGFLGVFTKKAFKKDEKMFISYYLKFPEDSYEHKKYDYLVNGEKFEFDSKVHTSQSNGFIYQYEWDSYLNHSCDRNIYCKLHPNDADGRLDTFAIKDIQAGEELTCDYNLLYETIIYPFDCLCGSSNCCKVIEKKKLLIAAK